MGWPSAIPFCNSNSSSVSGNFCPDFGIAPPWHVLHPAGRSLGIPGKTSDKNGEASATMQVRLSRALFVNPSAVEESLIFL
ncbi:MAG: hypothetical protein DME37_07050 [Verrucomicrobia bacterium]|nr:MAG: hypothetical protein DME37_07050 [Verrucomicrobiota bacterium]